MIYSFFRFIFIAFLFSSSIICVNAQTDASGSRAGQKEELPKGIKESLAKSRIEREKKDYEEMLRRGEEAAKLSEELDKSFIQNKSLTAEDRKKLERLEKLSKKIREELGGKDADKSENGGDDSDEKAFSFSEAFDKLKNISAKLSGELKKTSRYTVSAVAIQSSNTVLKLVRFLRQSKD
ncbi:MAG TPA: hypothetical protein VNI84_00785 [Pyrinomonadaceae bacterium]|nr:hypothetical protein [Pyrinomonadaceae bacterium]